jgi:hypothetical protein
LLVQKDSTGSKKKKTFENREDKEPASYPEKFTSLISQAQQWLEMLNKSKELSQQESIDKDLVHFKNSRFGNIKYHIFNKDVRNLPEYMPRRDYTLILADIPYGLQTKGCEHDDVAWGEQQLGDMVRAAKFITTAKEFRFIIIHSVEQYYIVRNALDKETNVGYSNGCW